MFSGRVVVQSRPTPSTSTCHFTRLNTKKTRLAFTNVAYLHGPAHPSPSTEYPGVSYLHPLPRRPGTNLTSLLFLPCTLHLPLFLHRIASHRIAFVLSVHLVQHNSLITEQRNNKARPFLHLDCACSIYLFTARNCNLPPSRAVSVSPSPSITQLDGTRCLVRQSGDGRLSKQCLLPIPLPTLHALPRRKPSPMQPQRSPWS